MGDNTNNNSTQPVQETTKATDWATVVVGANHTCAIKTKGALWCWGNNYNGQLGDGTLIDRSQPVQESTKATNWATFTGGIYHTCARKTNGTLWCWGANGYGQLGDGKAWKAVPVQVLNP